MTIELTMEDLIVKRAKNNRIAKNTRYITNVVLWSGLGVLIGTGAISVKFLGECLVIGCANKLTKKIIKKVKSRKK
jgi:hypothetical protein